YVTGSNGLTISGHNGYAVERRVNLGEFRNVVSVGALSIAFEFLISFIDGALYLLFGRRHRAFMARFLRCGFCFGLRECRWSSKHTHESEYDRDCDFTFHHFDNLRRFHLLPPNSRIRSSLKRPLELELNPALEKLCCTFQIEAIQPAVAI